jgi:hypothetical protein
VLDELVLFFIGLIFLLLLLFLLLYITNPMFVDQKKRKMTRGWVVKWRKTPRWAAGGTGPS